jgi:uncharacterized membrane protein
MVKKGKPNNDHGAAGACGLICFPHVRLGRPKTAIRWSTKLRIHKSFVVVDTVAAALVPYINHSIHVFVTIPFSVFDSTFALFRMVMVTRHH